MLACPLSKEPLVKVGCGFYSRVLEKVYYFEDMDFRILPNRTTEYQQFWSWGQKDYEKWEEDCYLNSERLDLLAERNALVEVYEKLGLSDATGTVIDIGGGLGLAKYFFPVASNFYVADPFHYNKHLRMLKECTNIERFRETYPFLFDSCIQYLCCDSEYLPFLNGSADIVHMRSCVDHFLNPEASLLEARRILKKDGYLIIGNSLDSVDERKSLQILEEIKNYVKSLSGRREHDHHTWHPTENNLESLIHNTGFKIKMKLYQESYQKRVIYFLLTR